MRMFAALLLLVAFTACEKKPTEEEIEAQEEAERAAAATPVPATPVPEKWMWKKYENPLEKKPVKN